MVVEPLKDSFGDAVNVNYFDATDDGIDSELKEIFEVHDYPFPLVFLNGELVSAGFISYYEVSERVNTVLGSEKH
jgi:disulfide oxidoreductase YuzD